MTLDESSRARPMAEWPITVDNRDYELAVYENGRADVLDTGAYLASLPPAPTPEARLLQRLRAKDAQFRYSVTVPGSLYFTLRAHANTDMPEDVAQEVTTLAQEIFEKQVRPQLKSRTQRIVLPPL